MKKVSNVHPAASNTGSSQATVGVGGVPMRRGGSTGSAHSRAPSTMPPNMRDSPIPKGDAGTSGTVF